MAGGIVEWLVSEGFHLGQDLPQMHNHRKFVLGGKIAQRSIVQYVWSRKSMCEVRGVDGADAPIFLAINASSVSYIRLLLEYRADPCAPESRPVAEFLGRGPEVDLTQNSH